MNKWLVILQWCWLVGLLSAEAFAGEPCVTDDEVVSGAEQDDAHDALNTALTQLVSTCTGNPGFVIKEAECHSPTVDVRLNGEIVGGVRVNCQDEDVAVTLVRDELKLHANDPITVVVKVGPNAVFTGEGTVPTSAEQAEASSDEVSPIITPRNIGDVSAHLVSQSSPHDETRQPKYIYVHENLAVDPHSDRFITDADRIVVRVIARRAVSCLYSVKSTADNKADHDRSRIGGDLGELKDLIGLVLTAATDKESEEKRQVMLCGEMVTVDDNGAYVIPSSDEHYRSVDFTFGPFSNRSVKLEASRYDVKMQEAQLGPTTIEVENHNRYIGWLDVAVLGTQVSGDKLHVDQVNGSELRRIRVESQQSNVDFAILVKLFAYCSGEENGWFMAQDLSAAAVCVGLGSGFSISDPTRRFYPLGFNVTFGSKVTLHGMSVLENGKTLAGGLNDGDLYSGSEADLATRSQLQWGYAVGVGFDPTLIGDVFSAIVGAF